MNLAYLFLHWLSMHRMLTFTSMFCQKCQIPHWLFHHKGKCRVFRYLLSLDCETFSVKASEVFGQRLESQGALGLKVQTRCFADKGGEVGELCNAQLVNGRHRTGPSTCHYQASCNCETQFSSVQLLSCIRLFATP